ncbi:MAG: NAD(P)-dependent oxidoreductase [Myxococcota bacterium]|jgi:3-hydroxyisobutyrate dehydrogenase|nr:NAD(P)-dependent oxidoreductase [Myxococcota bacterium]
MTEPSMPAERLAFLCLGTMGYPMAGHLARAGHEVSVYNRTTARAERWVEEFGGRLADTPAGAVDGARAVFICSGNDADLREVALGEGGALGAMGEGGLLVDHTTASPGLARELLVAAREKGVAFLDAPVSGGQSGAESGALTVMVGGEAAAYARASHWFDCYAKMHSLMGEAGSGQLTKAANQICIAGLVQGLAEGLDFAKRAGLDGARVVEVISKGAAQSWQMDNRALTMLAGEFDFGFAVDWMRKDLAIAFDEAREVGAELPVARLVDEFYERVQERGGGRLDTSSLMTLLDAAD